MKKKKKIIIAAGGLVWSEVGGIRKLAIVHRKRYDDWSLPKGKQKPNESVLATAIREVAEESGLKTTIMEFAGVIDYVVGDIPKLVFFWHMQTKVDTQFSPGDEVDRLEWVSPDEAIRRITYEEERRLIQVANTDVPSKHLQMVYNVLRLFVRRRFIRTRGALAAYREELENKMLRMAANRDQLLAIKRTLDKADFMLTRNRIDEAWKCFFAAQRIETLSFNGKELEIRAAILRREVEKLSAWRKDAVEDLLGSSKQPKSDVSHAHVYEAMLIRDEHYSNQAHKDAILRTHVWMIVLLLLSILITIVALTREGFLLFSGQNLDVTWKTLINVALFGLLGASFSAALKVPTVSKQSRIPELVGTLRVTIMRVIVGAVSAIIILIVLNSSSVKGLFNAVFNQEDLKQLSLPVIYFFAFVAGFTERLALKAVEFVAKDNK